MTPNFKESANQNGSCSLVINHSDVVIKPLNLEGGQWQVYKNVQLMIHGTNESL
jgi:hypothetical protein